jgi:formylglycine-generating enzyme
MGKLSTPAGRKWLLLMAGFIIAVIFLKAGKAVMDYTSTDKYCMSCHIHPLSDQSWKFSPHHKNPSGTIAHCSECHLPPKGQGYLFAKAKHGCQRCVRILIQGQCRDQLGGKRTWLDNAKHFVYEKSCLECHENLFPVTLSVDGSNAHLSIHQQRRSVKLY